MLKKGDTRMELGRRKIGRSTEISDKLSNCCVLNTIRKTKICEYPNHFLLLHFAVIHILNRAELKNSWRAHLCWWKYWLSVENVNGNLKFERLAGGIFEEIGAVTNSDVEKADDRADYFMSLLETGNGVLQSFEGSIHDDMPIVLISMLKGLKSILKASHSFSNASAILYFFFIITLQPRALPLIWKTTPVSPLRKTAAMRTSMPKERNVTLIETNHFKLLCAKL